MGDNKKMKKVLISGGAGFIGSNLALRLNNDGYEVTVLDNLSPQIHGTDPETDSELYNSVRDKVKFIKGSVLSKDIMKLALHDQELVVHLAAETGTGQSMYNIENYTSTNIQGTSILLDILANNKHTVEKLIVASSRSIYGEGKYQCEISNKYVYPESRDLSKLEQKIFDVTSNECDKLILCSTDEKSKIHPISVYGITKQVQEQLVMTVCKSIGVSATSLRFQNVYGPGQSLKNPYTGILSIFSTQIKNDNEVNIFEDGNESRDFVFIDDVIDSIVLCLEKEEARDEIFNVGTGMPTSVMEVASELFKNYNKPANYHISGNYRIGDIRHNYADISHIEKKLGFKPKVNFVDGIKRFAKWVNSQEIEKDNFQKTINELKSRGLYK
jgi:dTDP-L-rhamnose 4-epimerase